MNIFGKTVRFGIVIALLLGSRTTRTHGFGPGGGSAGSAVGGATRSAVQIRGTIVCAQCSLDDVQKTQPQRRHLYELTHRQGQIVLEVTQVNDPQTPLVLGSLPHLVVRAPDQVFAQLTAEEHTFKTVELSGLLRNQIIFDLVTVTIRG